MNDKLVNSVIGDNSDLICIECKKNKKMRFSAYCLQCKIKLEPDYLKRKLLRDYINILERKKKEGNYFMIANPNCQEIADKMFKAIAETIRKGLRTDYISQNYALKEACKINGIKTGKELRELFIKEVENDQ